MDMNTCPDPDEKRLSMRQACEISGIPEEELKQAIEDGEIPKDSVSGFWRIDPSALDDYLNKKSEENG